MEHRQNSSDPSSGMHSGGSSGPPSGVSSGPRGCLRRLKRETVVHGEIVDLCHDTVRLPDGKEEVWDFVHHKNGAGACIVPVLPDGRILMIQQYRPALDQEILELPAGGRDAPDEDPEVTARRELLEETGFTADRFVHLGRLMTAVAWCDEYTDLFLAKPVIRVSGQNLDEAEEIRVQPYSPETLLAMIRSLQLTDAKSVAGILAACQYAEGSKRTAASGAASGPPAGKEPGAMAGSAAHVKQ